MKFHKFHDQDNIGDQALLHQHSRFLSFFHYKELVEGVVSFHWHTQAHTKILFSYWNWNSFSVRKERHWVLRLGSPARLGSYSSKSVVRQGPHQISPCKWHISNSWQCLITVISWSVLLLLFFVGLFFVGVEETHDEMVSLLWEIWCCGKKVLLLPMLLYLLP